MPSRIMLDIKKNKLVILNEYTLTLYTENYVCNNMFFIALWEEEE